MRHRGYTLVELLVVLALLSIVLISVVGLLSKVSEKQRDMQERILNDIASVRVVKDMEQALDGCIDVNVEAMQVTIMTSTKTIVIRSADFNTEDEVTFERDENKPYVIVNMGGEQYWIPILREG